jgi:DNA polymerase-1
MYQVAIDKVTKNQRNDTKAIVFGSMFGRGAKAIAQQLGIADINIVAGRIADFFKQFIAAEDWFYETEEFAEKEGYVESPIGRRRRLITFKLGLSDKQEIARAKRIARNSPIQGISSDGAFLGSAMFCDWLIENDKWHVHPDKSCWLIQDVVHDSCVLQVPIEDVPEAIEALQPFFTTKLMERMTKVWGVQFNIPLEVDFEIGLKWGEMESWDGTQLHLDYLMNRIHKKETKRMEEAA